ncbi:hypothetical protein [Flavivirga jejuensis]|uniref:GLPGLI family protein n=1 Tax=Flavivirga jejuensis TaxID=870487 RepID=A0ABT8WMZ4_9FLAO|nr:hypothetical protein [Flavivirga jejuensis]MDO5974307.1 hypothetical protein [Flavivirga jejuensis]
MIKLGFIFSSLFALNTAANTNVNSDTFRSATCEGHYLDISNIVVYEVEEEIELGFNTKDYLPENFNPLKGKGDIDWSTIEVYKIEEDVEINFDTKKYLPKNFNALKGKGDIDWSRIEVFEIEEDVEIGFDTKKYLPENFSPYKGMC